MSNTLTPVSSATVPTKLVSTTGPLDTPEAYVVPGSLEIQLSSVAATFDGSGAGGDFDPTLSVYSKDGKLISRTKVGSTVTAGDSAVCTWIPFSRKQGTATPPTPGTIAAIHLATTTGLVFVPNNDNIVTFDQVSSFDGTVFATHTTAGRVDRVTVKKQGVYAVFGWLDWGSYAGLVKTTLFNLNATDTLGTVGQTTVNDSGTHVDVNPILAYTRTMPDVASWGDTIPRAWQFWVNQDSAGNRTTNIVYWEFQYLGATDH